MPEFFEQRYIKLKGPFTSAEFVAIRQEQWRLHREIDTYVPTYDRKAPFCDVYIPTKKKDLAPFGRKIVTGISSLVMGAITIAGFVNFVR